VLIENTNSSNILAGNGASGNGQGQGGFCWTTMRTATTMSGPTINSRPRRLPARKIRNARTGAEVQEGARPQKGAARFSFALKTGLERQRGAKKQLAKTRSEAVVRLVEQNGIEPSTS